MRYKFYLLTTICLLALTRGMGQHTDSCNAGFGYSISQANGKSVTFVAYDSGQANTVISTWNFGDGSTQLGIKVSHTYAAWGTYTVTHVIVDSATHCMDSSSQTIQIDTAVQDSSCFPGGISFSYVRDSSKAFTYTFTPSPNSSADHYYWNFGDGTTSTQRTPTHTFGKGDSALYSALVSLTIATSGKDSCSASTSQLLSLGGPVKDSTPTCNLASTVTIIDSTFKNKPGFFQFYAYPQNPTYKYSWNFGDGTTSTQMDPTHQYKVANQSYTVTLFVVAPPTKAGQDSCTGLAQLITTNLGGDSTHVGCTLGTANFSYTSDTAHPYTVHFLPSPDSSKYNYSWNFGDGTTSTIAAPTHSYANVTASYAVSLLINQSGPDSCQGFVQNNVHVQSDSTGNDSTGNRCALGSLSFSYATDSAAKRTVHFLPSPDSSAYHYYWNFGDGSTSTQAAPTHTYAAGSSSFTVNLIATTSGPDSCQGQAQHTVYFSDSTRSDSTQPVCALNFGTSFSYIIDSSNLLVYHFIPQPDSASYNYYWSFGDGNSSRLVTPTHMYAHPGSYQVVLTITSAPLPGLNVTDSCAASVGQRITVDTIAVTSCSVTFTYSFDSTNGRTVTLQAHPVPDSASFVTWYISKGADSSTRVTLTGFNPTYTFPDTGVYTVDIVANQPNGCVGYTEGQISVSGKNWISTPNDTVARIQSYPNPATDIVNLKVTLKNAGPISITIFSAMGSQVGVVQTSGASGDNQVSIPVKNLPQGIYFMHIQSGNTSSQSRFQKQ
jgi:PKD repeat protein